jgi:hypothetical protein
LLSAAEAARLNLDSVEEEVLAHDSVVVGGQKIYDHP